MGLTLVRSLNSAQTKIRSDLLQKAIQALVETAPCANIYPSVDARELRGSSLKIYRAFRFQTLSPQGQEWTGFLDGICRLVIEKGDEVIVPTPTFAYYELPARACGGKPVFVREEPGFLA